MAKLGAIYLDLIFLICVTGCASQAEFASLGNQMPSEWSLENPLAGDKCVPIDGAYLNRGTGKMESSAALVENRLDAALGHTYPSVRMPNMVNISVKNDSNSISILFGDPINESFSVDAICSNGWYQIEETQSSQYIGDGTNLDFANRKILLGKATDGDLLVHLFLEAQFSSLAVARATEKREIWSKYKMVAQENLEGTHKN